MVFALCDLASCFILLRTCRSGCRGRDNVSNWCRLLPIVASGRLGLINRRPKVQGRGLATYPDSEWMQRLSTADRQ